MTVEGMVNNVQSPFSTRLEWVSQLDVQKKPTNFRKTSIICTIGPKVNSIQMITELRKAGMNITRLNFSHGSYEYHASVIKNVRDSFDSFKGRPVAIALDTKGPEIRTGKIMGDAEVSYSFGL
jgi:pyruvate kinase